MFYSLIFLLVLKYCSSEYFTANKSNVFSITENDKSYFGYSLQLQRSETNEFGRIIVGAPKASSKTYPNNHQSGGTYSCSVNTKKCEEFLLELNEAQMSNIGLGSAIDADKDENGFVITCAPKWTDTKYNGTKGMCFSQKNNFLNKLYPLQKIPLFEKGVYYSQFGQVGFSAHLVENQENSLILGSPGIYSWTGTLVQYKSLDKNENSTIATPYRADNKIDFNSYFGYAISAGKFNASNFDQIYHVAGAPRNKDLYGSVNIFDPIKNEPFKNRFMFTGTQFGEYFGASIAVGNLDSDILDDIIIGAPTHSYDEEGDIGCIYVFRAVSNKNNLEFKKYVKILGEKRGGKFGFALSYLGDINKDGFGDIAVGAPYYNDHGAVYIYFGSENGLIPIYKQRILASAVDKTLRGFGYSLSRGLDVDSNTNNDLAVGAFISGKVVLLTSRPMVKIQTNMTVDQGSQLNINTTNLIIKYCLTHETDNRLPPNHLNLVFSVLYTSKVTFPNRDFKWEKVVIMEGKMELCDTFKIFVDNAKLFEDVFLKMNYEVLSTSSEEKFKPHEEKHSPTTLHIPFNKGCTTNICKPNLKLTTFLTNMEANWIIHNPKNIELLVKLENVEDHSYTNKLEIQVTPKHIKFSLLPNYCDTKNDFVICNFKYPILKNEIKNIFFELDATKLNIDDEKITINATIISAEDIDNTDNTKIIEIPLKSDINFKVLPKSQPEEINNLTEIQTISHLYNIENFGVTQVKHLKLNVLIPYKIEETMFLHFMNITGCSHENIVEFIPTKNENHYIGFDFSADSLFINCSSPNVKCRKVECEMMDSLNSFSINISMTINSKLIGELNNEGPIILSTTLEPDEKFISTYSHTWTKLKQVITQQTASITKYLIIGISVSLLLVLILIFILYKCGFFRKRKLPDRYEHAQLLNGVIEKNEF